MKLLLKDEDFPLGAFLKLKELGHDVLTLNDLELNDQKFPDAAVLDEATSLNRAVVTHNRRDFIKLHRGRTKPHSGIIVCTRFADDGDLADAVHATINNVDVFDQLIRIIRPQIP